MDLEHQMVFVTRSTHQLSKQFDLNQVNALSIDDMESAYLKTVRIDWSTSHDLQGVTDYGMPPNIYIEVVLPICDKKMQITLFEVSKLHTHFLSEIEVSIEEYSSYYQVYLNSMDLNPNDFIECKNLNVVVVDYVTEI